MNGLFNWRLIAQMNFQEIIDEKTYDPGVNWDKAAEMYDGMAKLEEKYTLNQINLLPLNQDTSVLDIGCGPGRLTIPIAERCHKVTAIDASSAMLDKCKNNASQKKIENITWIKKDWKDEDFLNTIKPHDIVVASRTVALGDLKKLNALATKFVFLICWANSPSLKDIHSKFVRGITEPETKSNIDPRNRMLGYNLLFNQLYDLGVNPNVVVVEDGFEKTFKTREEAYESLRFVGNIPVEKESLYRNNIDNLLDKTDKGNYHLHQPTQSYVMWWNPKEMVQQ